MRLFILAVLLSLLHICNAQKATFDIFLFGNKIGQTIVERAVKNDSITQYTLNSSSEAHVFFTRRKITLHYDVTFKRNLLIASYSKHTRNDEVHYNTITWLGTKYFMKRDSAAFNINKPIECATVELFFSEPVNLTTTFSERLGEFRTIKKIDTGVYQAEMSEGITFFYRYKNGKLVELEMKKGLLGSIYLRPSVNP